MFVCRVAVLTETGRELLEDTAVERRLHASLNTFSSSALLSLRLLLGKWMVMTLLTLRKLSTHYLLMSCILYNSLPIAIRLRNVIQTIAVLVLRKADYSLPLDLTQHNYYGNKVLKTKL